MTDTRIIALGIEYDGQHFHGWQSQKSPSVATVQRPLEQALSFIANHDVSIVCAGRTDKGVHATGQVVSFISTAERPDKAWVQGVSSRLPASIAVKWVKTVGDDFHARFTAFQRRYFYYIDNSPVRGALSSGRVTHQPRALDHHKMQAAAQYLLGEHDFSAFRGAGCQSRSPNRCVTDIQVERLGQMIRVNIAANAFLLHMVRNIVGSLMDVGMGLQPVDWLANLLQQQDRTLAGVTAPPDGLYLVDVSYPECYGIPSGTVPQLVI